MLLSAWILFAHDVHVSLYSCQLDSCQLIVRHDKMPAMVKLLHYAVLTVIVLGAVYYVWTKPPTINPMIDRRGADALAMVQTHRAVGYPTILQAMTEHVRSMKDRGLNARLGEWRVKQVDGDLYEVRVQLRDKGVSGQWFEREFIWHANLSLKRVNAASLPADGITPKPEDINEPALPSPTKPPNVLGPPA